MPSISSTVVGEAYTTASARPTAANVCSSCSNVDRDLDRRSVQRAAEVAGRQRVLAVDHHGRAADLADLAVPDGAGREPRPFHQDRERPRLVGVEQLRVVRVAQRVNQRGGPSTGHLDATRSPTGTPQSSPTTAAPSTAARLRLPVPAQELAVRHGLREPRQPRPRRPPPQQRDQPVREVQQPRDHQQHPPPRPEHLPERRLDALAQRPPAVAERVDPRGRQQRRGVDELHEPAGVPDQRPQADVVRVGPRDRLPATGGLERGPPHQDAVPDGERRGPATVRRRALEHQRVERGQQEPPGRAGSPRARRRHEVRTELRRRRHQPSDQVRRARSRPRPRTTATLRPGRTRHRDASRASSPPSQVPGRSTRPPRRPATARRRPSPSPEASSTTTTRTPGCPTRPGNNRGNVASSSRAGTTARHGRVHGRRGHLRHVPPLPHGPPGPQHRQDRGSHADHPHATTLTHSSTWTCPISR